MTWNNLRLDETKSPVFDELHAIFDNYQIYSLAWNDENITSIETRYLYGINLPPVKRQISRNFIGTTIASGYVASPFISGIERGHTFKYYSRLIPYSKVDGQYSTLQFFDLFFDGYDDPSRQIARVLPSFSVVDISDFDFSGWMLDGILDVPDYDIANPPATKPSGYFTSAYQYEENVLNRSGSSYSEPPTIDLQQKTSCIAYQSFDPKGKIEQDFSIFVADYPVNTTSRNTSFINLINGFSLDNRAKANTIEFISNFTGSFKCSYYAQNILETHPRIAATLDWRERTIDVMKNQKCIFKVDNIVLGTLLVDSKVKPLIISIAKLNNLPIKYFFKEFIPELIIYWNTLIIPFPPPDTSRYANNFIWTGQPFPDNLIYSSSVSTSDPILIRMAANNNRWNHGSDVTSTNKPANTHLIFNDFDHQSFFETIQPDGSFGTYMTDSPRLIEMWQSLGAGTYATDADGQPRKVNIGWGIMKLLEVMGIRRQPNGKYLTTAESKKYERTRENKPTWKQGDYGVGEWGEYGLAFKYLPTTYIDGQRQDNQHDLVHDVPQLMAAIIDQLDHALNIQHGSEVRIPVGKDVQAYPNQGAATIDTAARIIQLERMVEQLLVMNIETSNSVRELFPGIGIPITTKAVKVDVGGQIRDIQYPGYQQSKPSLAESIGSLKVNVAQIFGALMPRKSPKNNPMNPWSWNKK